MFHLVSPAESRPPDLLVLFRSAPALNKVFSASGKPNLRWSKEPVVMFVTCDILKHLIQKPKNASKIYTSRSIQAHRISQKVHSQKKRQTFVAPHRATWRPYARVWPHPHSAAMPKALPSRPWDQLVTWSSKKFQKVHWSFLAMISTQKKSTPMAFIGIWVLLLEKAAGAVIQVPPGSQKTSKEILNSEISPEQACATWQMVPGQRLRVSELNPPSIMEIGFWRGYGLWEKKKNMKKTIFSIPSKRDVVIHPKHQPFLNWANW